MPQQLTHLILDLAAHIRRHPSTCTGLPLRHQRILTDLDAHSPTCQSDISARLRMDPADLADTLKQMEFMGLVSRRRDPADRRRMQVTLTPTGRDHIHETQADPADDPFASLSQEEKELLAELIRRVLQEPHREAAPRSASYRDDPRWRVAQANYIAEHGDPDETYRRRIEAATEMRLIQSEYRHRTQEAAS